MKINKIINNTPNLIYNDYVDIDNFYDVTNDFNIKTISRIISRKYYAINISIFEYEKK